LRMWGGGHESVEELHDLQTTLIHIRTVKARNIRRTEHVCRMHARLVKCVQNFVKKAENERQLERRRRRCEDNIKVVD